MSPITKEIGTYIDRWHFIVLGAYFRKVSALEKEHKEEARRLLEESRQHHQITSSVAHVEKNDERDGAEEFDSSISQKDKVCKVKVSSVVCIASKTKIETPAL